MNDDERYLTASEKEIRQLRAELAREKTRGDQLATQIEKAERDVDRYRGYWGAAQVDADRRNLEMRRHLDDVLAELVRRGVATDLVPSWWRSPDPGSSAEAEMRAGWPENVALAQRCRELVEAVRAAEEETERQVRMRRDADRSRDGWREAAIAHGYSPPKGPDWSDPEVRARENAEMEVRELARRKAERRERKAIALREHAEHLAEFVRRLTRLPVAVKKLPIDELYALAEAIAPARRGHAPCALPDAVVAEVCLRAAQFQTFDIVRQYELNFVALDDAEVLDRVLASYGTAPAPVAPAGGAEPTLPLFDTIPGGGA